MWIFSVGRQGFPTASLYQHSQLVSARNSVCVCVRVHMCVHVQAQLKIKIYVKKYYNFENASNLSWYDDFTGYIWTRNFSF